MHAESVGDLRTAEQECAAAAGGFAAIDDVPGEARSLLHLGTARWATGRLEEAAAAQDRSIALFRSASDDGGAGLGLVLRARTALDRGDTGVARDLLLEARHVLGRAGDRHLLALCLDQHARTCLVDGAVSEAHTLARESLETFEAVGYVEGVSAALQTLGQVHLAVGEPATATALLLRAAESARDLGQPAAMAECLELLAEAALARDDASGAARLLGTAEQLRDAKGLPRTALQCRRVETWRSRLAGLLGDGYPAAVADGRRSSADQLMGLLATTAADGR
jgi:tetratricopeptide (TPR) repeat protein